MPHYLGSVIEESVVYCGLTRHLSVLGRVADVRRLDYVSNIFDIRGEACSKSTFHDNTVNCSTSAAAQDWNDAALLTRQ